MLQVTVIRGALDLTAKKARQAMTPLDKVRLKFLQFCQLWMCGKPSHCSSAPWSTAGS